MSIFLWILFILFLTLVDAFFARVFGNRWHLWKAVLWTGCIIYNILVWQDIFGRVMFTIFAITDFWYWWHHRPPRDKGKFRRAVGARVQAIIDRMTEITKPAHGGAGI